MMPDIQLAVIARPPGDRFGYRAPTVIARSNATKQSILLCVLPAAPWIASLRSQ
jgi:hypothetical protein